MRSTAGIAHDAFASIWRVAGRRFRPDPELRQRSAKDFTTEDTGVTGETLALELTRFGGHLTVSNTEVCRESIIGKA
jgi:hypothetical protein